MKLRNIIQTEREGKYKPTIELNFDTPLGYTLLGQICYEPGHDKEYVFIAMDEYNVLQCYHGNRYHSVDEIINTIKSTFENLLSDCFQNY